MTDKIKVIVFAPLIVVCIIALVYSCSHPEPIPEVPEYVKNELQQRIGNPDYTVELCWVARDKQNKVYIVKEK